LKTKLEFTISDKTESDKVTENSNYKEPYIYLKAILNSLSRINNKYQLKLNLTNCDLSGFELGNLNFNRANFNSSMLVKIRFTESQLTEVDFSSSDIRNVDLVNKIRGFL